MKYLEKRTLARRGPIESLPPDEVEGILLVGETYIADWEEGHKVTGCDHVKLFPAFYRGERAWLLRRTWCPSEKYSAEGTEEEILSFEEGVKLLLNRGAFEHLFPCEPVRA